MNYKEAVKIIYQKKWLVFWAAILGAVLVFDLMVIQVPKYKASSKILVIQKQVAGQDIYTISKSAQYLSGILKEVVYSDSFFEKILESPFGVEEANFSTKIKERRKKWEESVKISVSRDLGIIEINVFHPRREIAERTNQAIIDVFFGSHSFYHGANQNVKIVLLNKTLTTEKPLMIDLWLGSVLGALIGLLIGVGWVLRKGTGVVVRDSRSGEEFTSIGKEIAKIREQRTVNNKQWGEERKEDKRIKDEDGTYF